MRGGGGEGGKTGHVLTVPCTTWNPEPQKLHLFMASLPSLNGADEGPLLLDANWMSGFGVTELPYGWLQAAHLLTLNLQTGNP